MGVGADPRRVVSVHHKDKRVFAANDARESDLIQRIWIEFFASNFLGGGPCGVDDRRSRSDFRGRKGEQAAAAIGVAAASQNRDEPVW